MLPSLSRADCAYTPYYCEENVWHLLQRPELAASEPAAIFISNPGRSCALGGQRLQPSPGEPVIWDYHVVALTRSGGEALIWDLDSTLPWPSPATAWLRQTFALTPRLPELLHPRFRVIDAVTFRQRFASDRSHMRSGGAWAQPPPTWPLIQIPEASMNLDDFVDTERPGLGQTFDLTGLLADLRGATRA